MMHSQFEIDSEWDKERYVGQGVGLYCSEALSPLYCVALLLVAILGAYVNGFRGLCRRWCRSLAAASG